MDHYCCQACLLGKAFFFIWYSDDIDGVVLNDAGKIATFASEAAAMRYAERSGYQLLEQTEPPYYDFDKIAHWAASPAPEKIDCQEFLDTWNLLNDILGNRVEPSVFNAHNGGSDHCYNKLFWGNNLPSVTPEGEHYTPAWSNEEVLELAQLFATGIEDLKGLID